MSQKNKEEDDFEIKDALEILSQKDENSKLTVCKLINLICQKIALLIKKQNADVYICGGLVSELFDEFVQN
jgi:hypothetical protein